jgi:cyclase
MVALRIIPCLDVKDGEVVKGVRFKDHRSMGDIVALAQRYRRDGADELVFYDITASPERRSVDVAWIERVAQAIDIPFCVAGGIADVETARQVLKAGADKISINSPALADPSLIARLVDALGSQCIVVGIDSIASDGQWWVRQYTGNPDAMVNPNRLTLDWLAEVQRLGAGEVVLNCMDADGVRHGYDIDQLTIMRKACQVPLIASGGAGEASHFVDVFQRANVDGALAATVFHTMSLPIPRLKHILAQEGLPIRPADSLEGSP